METTTEDKIRLLDIADGIREIQGYLGEAGYQEFTVRENVRESVSAQLVMIGGAAALLSDEFKEQYGEIDWDMLKGLQYAHYDEELELDPHAMLHIAGHDLPALLDDVLRVAETMDDLQEDSLNREDYENLKNRQERQRNKYKTDPEEDFTSKETNEDEDMGEQEDDSYIDKRFTDEDILKNSSLDDMQEEDRSPKPKPGKK